MKRSIISALIIVLFVGCASVAKRLIEPPSDEYTLYARGLSTDQLAEEEADFSAELNARNRLATQIEAHIKSKTKRAREQVGIGKDAELNSQYSIAIKQTVDETLNFSSVYEIAETRWDKKVYGYRAEVILKVDIGPINELMLDNIKQRKNLYERLRTSELFNEMEEDIDKKRAYEASD